MDQVVQGDTARHRLRRASNGWGFSLAKTRTIELRLNGPFCTCFNRQKGVVVKLRKEFC